MIWGTGANWEGSSQDTSWGRSDRGPGSDGNPECVSPRGVRGAWSIGKPGRLDQVLDIFAERAVAIDRADDREIPLAWKKQAIKVGGEAAVDGVGSYG